MSPLRDTPFRFVAGMWRPLAFRPPGAVGRGSRRLTCATRVGMLAAAVLGTALAPSEGASQPPAHTAATVAAQPLPGDESGRVDGDRGEPAIAVGVRAVLFLPRVAMALVFAPVRASIYMIERHELVERYRRLFYGEGGSFGIAPVIAFQSGFGVTIGAKLVHSNLFGAHERLTLRAATGGRLRQSYRAGLTTGERLGEHFVLELRGFHEIHPEDPFYGIGNGDDAIDTRYHKRTSRTWLTTDISPLPSLHLRPSLALADVDVSRGSGDPIDVVFRPRTLAGFGGYRSGYAELELRWDDRGPSTDWESGAVPSRGSFASVFAGAMSIEHGPELWRVGTDLQHFIRIGEGPRVISARLHGEAITGSAAEVPFTELPTLGGETFLRGYPIERFRDRLAAVGALEYVWDLSQLFRASAFVDVGRVYPSFDALSFDDMRVGYGVELQLHTSTSFIARVLVASSIDGGVVAFLSFDPAFEVTTRVTRR